MKRIFILHGWVRTIEKWQPFVNYLKDEKHEVTILKIPGLTQKIDGVWTLDRYVDWLKETLDKTTDKVILIGHSNGGRIALAFAARYPEKLEKLILIDAGGIRHSELPLAAKRLVFKIIAKIGKKLTRSEKLKNLLYKLAKETDYKNSDPVIQKTMINLISVNLKPVLSKIKAPTVVIWGEKDTTIPLSDGKLIHKMIKKSKLYIIKEARHSPQYTYPELVADQILGEINSEK